MKKPGRAVDWNPYEGQMAKCEVPVQKGTIMKVTRFEGGRIYTAPAQPGADMSGRLMVAAHGAHEGGDLKLVPWLFLDGQEFSEAPGSLLYLTEGGLYDGAKGEGKRPVGRILQGNSICLDPNAP